MDSSYLNVNANKLKSPVAKAPHWRVVVTHHENLSKALLNVSVKQGGVQAALLRTLPTSREQLLTRETSFDPGTQSAVLGRPLSLLSLALQSKSPLFSQLN